MCRDYACFLALSLLSTVTVGIAGCRSGSQNDDVSVKAPLGIEVNVNDEGFALKAPGVDVKVNDDGTTVDAPGVDVRANAQGVTVDAPLGVSVKTGQAAQPAAQQPPPAQQPPTK